MQSADELALKALRAMTPAARLHLALELSETARQLALAGARARLPGATEAELCRELISMAERVELPRQIPG